MLLSQTTVLQIKNRQIEIYQQHFSVFDRNVAVADSCIPVRNVDVVSKTDVSCGQTAERCR